MRLSGFNLNQLVCLEALLHECNVSRAARRVNLSQSAMSAILAQLRNHFDDEILVRSGRRMVLTPFAKNLIAPLNELLAQAHSFSALRPGDRSTSIDREIKLVASDYVFQICLSDGINEAKNTLPGVRFEVLPLAENAERILQNGEIDLVFAGQTLNLGVPPDKEVFRDEFVCLTCRDRGPGPGELTQEEYIAREHIVIRYFEHQMLIEDEDLLRRAGKIRRRCVTVWSYLMVPNLLCASPMIATVPARIAEHMVRYWNLRIHPFPFRHDPVRVYAYWHPSRESDSLMKSFLELLG